ncbi:MAG: hypothetical protein ACYTF8_16095 [Planctomycetota bacterium]
MTARPSTPLPQKIANRTLPVLSLVAFALPFATVKGCNSDKVEEYTGFELLGRTGSEGLFLVIGIAVLLFGLSFVRPRATVLGRGLVQALKAFACACAGFFALLSTGLMFLFDKVAERSGLLLAVFSWWVLYTLSMGLAFYHLAEARGRRARRQCVVGYGIGILLPLLHLWMLGLDEPPRSQEFWDALSSLVFLVPLVLVGWFVVLWWRRRRATYST